MTENSKRHQSPYEIREEALREKWSQEGQLHVHYCPEWDHMLICAASPEYEACVCEKPQPDRHLFKTRGAPALLGDEVKENPSPPYLFPIKKDILSLSDVTGWAQARNAEKGVLAFLTDQGKVAYYVFGDLMEHEMIHMLEATKMQQMLACLAGGEDDV